MNTLAERQRLPRHKKDYITGEEWGWMEREGKLEPIEIGKITCYVCENPVSDTHTDARGVILPYCKCGIFYQLTWVLTDGTLSVKILPRTERDTYREAEEIPKDTTKKTTTQAPKHKDVKAKILDLLIQHTTITTAEIKKHIDASKQSINTALKKLIDENKIIKIDRGLYQRVEN